MSDEIITYKSLEDIPLTIFLRKPKQEENQTMFRGNKEGGEYVLVKRENENEEPPEGIFYIVNKNGTEYKKAVWKKPEDLKDDMDNEEEKDAVKNKVELLKSKTIDVFEYLNHDVAKQCYSARFVEPEIEELVAEVLDSNKVQIGANISNFLSAKTGKEVIHKIIYKLRAESSSPETKFNEYQRYMIAKSQVSLNLEYLDINSTELAQFEEAIDAIDRKFNITLDSKEIQDRKKELEKRAADEILKRLKNASGQVIIKGKFIVKSLSQNEFELVHKHPISSTIKRMINRDVVISVVIQKDELDSRTRIAYEKAAKTYEEYLKERVELGDKGIPESHTSKRIKTKRRFVYGQIADTINPEEDDYELTIIPFAIYS